MKETKRKEERKTIKQYVLVLIIGAGGHRGPDVRSNLFGLKTNDAEERMAL